MFPKTLSGTNAYIKVGFPSEALFVTPDIPKSDTINIYKRTYYAEPSAEAAQAIMDDIFPLLEDIQGIDIPALTITENNGWYGTSTDTDGIQIYASSSVHDDSVHWYGSGLAPLVFDGKSLYLNVWQTDAEIMQSLSSAISYLAQTFNMDLSAHRIYRTYSSYDGSLTSIIVYLYSAGQESDAFFKQYSEVPSYYSSGEMLKLFFYSVNQNKKNDTLKCTQTEYTRKPQPLYEVHSQCRMLSLREAEYLLEQGCVFSTHNYPICVRQSEVDFTIYDRVSLEYVFAREYVGYAVPVYTFYKKKIQEDGFSSTPKPQCLQSRFQGWKRISNRKKSIIKNNRSIEQRACVSTPFIAWL